MVTTGTGAFTSLIWRRARVSWHQSVIGAPLVPIGSLLMPGLLRGLRIYGSVPLPVRGGRSIVRHEVTDAFVLMSDWHLFQFGDVKA